MDVQTSHSTPFGELLDTIGMLSTEDQLTLVDIVRHRLTEQARKQIAASVREARKEYAEGECCQVTIDQLRDEITS
jgi:hypothetical protein